MFYSSAINVYGNSEKNPKKLIVYLKAGNHSSVDQLKMDYSRYSIF